MVEPPPSALGERPKTRVSLRVIPQRGRWVMPWEWMPACVRCTLASTSAQPSRPSQNQSCEKIQGIGCIPFCQWRGGSVFDVPAGSPSSAHDEVEASPRDPRAGPPNELRRSLRSRTVAVAHDCGQAASPNARDRTPGMTFEPSVGTRNVGSASVHMPIGSPVSSHKRRCVECGAEDREQTARPTTRSFIALHWSRGICTAAETSRLPE